MNGVESIRRRIVLTFQWDVMHRARIAPLALLLSIATTVAAHGQSLVSARLDGASAPGPMAAVTAFGYYMSPYEGTVNGQTGIRLNCVDFFHDVNLGEVWTATTVNLGDAIANESLLKNTRDGSNGLIDPRRRAAWTKSFTFMKRRRG